MWSAWGDFRSLLFVSHPQISHLCSSACLRPTPTDTPAACLSHLVSCCPPWTAEFFQCQDPEEGGGQQETQSHGHTLGPLDTLSWPRAWPPAGTRERGPLASAAAFVFRAVGKLRHQDAQLVLTERLQHLRGHGGTHFPRLLWGRISQGEDSRRPQEVLRQTPEGSRPFSCLGEVSSPHSGGAPG